jgi:glycosyltransferase involved in cell wall biosynthesis
MEKNNSGKVSAIIIVYNDEKRIGLAVQSALNQTYKNLEIIVVDDGSTDSSYMVTKRFEEDGVTVLSKENGGAASARNLGVYQSSGRYIAFLDSDDIWLPNKIETMIEAVRGVSDPVVAYSSYFFVNDSYSVTGQIQVCAADNAYDALLARKQLMLPSTMLLSRDAFDRVGGFPEERDVNMSEDLVFSLMVAKVAVHIPVEEHLLYYMQSTLGGNRAAVFDYSLTNKRYSEVIRLVSEVLTDSEVVFFARKVWSNTFAKFAMYGQFRSARKLAREKGLKFSEECGSIRGLLAWVSSFSCLPLLGGLRKIVALYYRKKFRDLNALEGLVWEREDSFL